MGSYRGQAWVTDPDGSEVEVRADLHAGTDWRGTLGVWGGTLAGSADWFGLQQSGELVRLRIGDRVGECIVSHTDLADPSGRAQVSGSGPHPFD